ncbi:MAG: helix-turn-helix domain-containing protein [Treponema sp.]|jgi:transcriptional regulator with XRE-family HTH domain|nr:helix-turn-helix domain-containing protein [Treponema sp.]
MAKLSCFGQKCAEMRKRFGVNQAAVAEKMGYTQEYLSKLENGRKPLTIALLKKYLAAFQSLSGQAPVQTGKEPGIFSLADQLEFTRDIFEHSDKIEMPLSGISIAHRGSLARLAAVLTVDEFYPLEILDGRFKPWLPINKAVDLLKEAPEQFEPGVFDLQYRFDGYYKNKNRGNNE